MYFTQIGNLHLATDFFAAPRPTSQSLFPVGNSDRQQISAMKLGSRSRNRDRYRRATNLPVHFAKVS